METSAACRKVQVSTDALDRLAKTPARILTGRAGDLTGPRRCCGCVLIMPRHAMPSRPSLTCSATSGGSSSISGSCLRSVRSAVQAGVSAPARSGTKARRRGAYRDRAAVIAGSDVQVVIGDGLSAAAVAAQVPSLLPLLHAEAIARGWAWGQPFSSATVESACSTSWASCSTRRS